MKRFGSLALAATIALATTSAWGGGVECAIQLALESKSVLGTPVEAYHHQFTIRPIDATDVGKAAHVITGTIMRHNKGGQDDQVDYRVTKEKGAIKEVVLKINGGKWEPLSAAMTGAMGIHGKGQPMSKEEQNAAADAMYNAGKGSWRNAVECLIARIGVLHC